MKSLLPRNGVLVCTPERLSEWMKYLDGARLDRMNHIRHRADMPDLTLEDAARLMIGSTEESREEIKERIA